MILHSIEQNPLKETITHFYFIEKEACMYNNSLYIINETSVTVCQLQSSIGKLHQLEFTTNKKGFIFGIRFHFIQLNLSKNSTFNYNKEKGKYSSCCLESHFTSLKQE